MATKVQLPAGEEITVQADKTSASAAGAAQAKASAAPTTTTVSKAGGKIPQQMLDKGINLSKMLHKTLMQAHEAKIAARLQDTSLGGALGLTWEVATAGPFNLSAPTLALSPNRVIQGMGVAGPVPPDLALMIGISYAGDPLTQFALADKDYDARFTVVNLSNVTSGMAAGTAMTSPIFNESTPGGVVVVNPLNVGDFANSPFEFFLWYFIPALTLGADQELYDVNFTIDLISDAGSPPPGIPGAGFSNWNLDPYGNNAIPIGVPGDGPHWQEAISGRFLVNDPNN